MRNPKRVHIFSAFWGPLVAGGVISSLMPLAVSGATYVFNNKHTVCSVLISFIWFCSIQTIQDRSDRGFSLFYLSHTETKNQS